MTEPRKIKTLEPFTQCRHCGWALFVTDTDKRDDGTPKVWLTKGKGKHEIITRVLLCPKCGKLTRKGRRLQEGKIKEGDWLGS